jgi:hypothetical protein
MKKGKNLMKLFNNNKVDELFNDNKINFCRIKIQHKTQKMVSHISGAKVMSKTNSKQAHNVQRKTQRQAFGA